MAENWYLVRQLRNPVRGDCGQVSLMCRRYSALADTFESMAGQLRGSVGGLQQGKWAEALKEKAGRLPADFTKFADSFRQVSGALSDWQVRLEPWRQKAVVALREAEQADADRRAARGALLQAEGEKVRAEIAGVAGADNGAQLLRVRDQISQYKRRLADANGRIGAAAGKVRAVKDDYDQAGWAIASRIDTARECAPKLEFWEGIVYSDWWKVLAGVAKVAAVVLAIALCFFSGGALAIALAAASAIIAFDSFMQWQVGDKSGLEFGVDLVFGVLALVPAGEALWVGGKALKGGASVGAAFACEATGATRILLRNLSPLSKSQAVRGLAAGIKQAGKNLVSTGRWSNPVSAMSPRAAQELKGAVGESVRNLVTGKDSFLHNREGLRSVIIGEVVPGKKKMAAFHDAKVRVGQYKNLYHRLGVAERGPVGITPLAMGWNLCRAILHSDVLVKGAEVASTYKPVVSDGVASFINLTDPLSRDGLTVKKTMGTLIRPLGAYEGLKDAMR